MQKHTEGDRVAGVSYAFYRVSVCPHDITKTAETKITKLGTRIVHHDISPTNEY